jgi:hypothetical protein
MRSILKFDPQHLEYSLERQTGITLDGAQRMRFWLTVTPRGEEAFAFDHLRWRGGAWPEQKSARRRRSRNLDIR